MRYKNIKTGFIFDSESEVNAPGWVKLDPSEDKTKEPVKDKKPATKRTAKK